MVTFPMSHSEFEQAAQIIVLRNRLWALPVMFLTLLCCITWIGGLIFLARAGFLQEGAPWRFLLFFLFLFALCCWGLILWVGATQHLFARNPLVRINEQGIYIGKLPTVTMGDTLLAWEDIKSISLSRRGFETFLAVNPKDVQKYLKRFPCWRRIVIRSHASLNRGVFFSLPQTYMRSKAEDVLYDIAKGYANTLQRYTIQLIFR